MRIFVQDRNASPEVTIRRALDTLLKAGIYSAAGGGVMYDRAVVLIAAAHVPEAIAALSQARMRAIIE